MLLVDCHEPRQIIEKLQPDIPVKVIKLKYGDYSFSDIVIERKTLSDFFSSLKNDRLNEQMENISRYYSEKFLLIEGFFDFSYVNNIDYIYSMLIGITLDFDVKILFSKDIDKTADFIRRIYLRKNFGPNHNNFRKDKPYHASKFFEISEKKLKILFLKFGNINNISKSTNKEFKKIGSIGKRTVEKIRDTLNSNIFG